MSYYASYMINECFLQDKSNLLSGLNIDYLNIIHPPATPSTVPLRSSLTRGSAVLAVQRLQIVSREMLANRVALTYLPTDRSATRLRFRSDSPSLTLRSRGSGHVLHWTRV